MIEYLCFCSTTTLIFVEKWMKKIVRKLIKESLRRLNNPSLPIITGPNFLKLFPHQYTIFIHVLVWSMAQPLLWNLLCLWILYLIVHILFNLGKILMVVFINFKFWQGNIKGPTVPLLLTVLRFIFHAKWFSLLKFPTKSN